MRAPPARAAFAVVGALRAVGAAALRAMGAGGAAFASASASASVSASTAAAAACSGGGGSNKARRGFFRASTGPGKGASNNWVVGGALTASGKPLLGNDPHLALYAPSLWQLTSLSCQQAGIEVIGASFAGLPGIVIGRNQRIAWGVTNTGVDIQDLYIMSELNSSYYLLDGVPVAYNVSTAVIRVSGAADEVMTVRSTVFGPVVTDNGVVDGLGGPPLSLRWASVDPAIADTSFAAFYGLQRAANWSDFRGALRWWSALASQNVVFADSDGNIGYQLPGFVPTRAPGHSGAFPVPGNSTFRWRAPIPFDSLPRTLNPPEGFIVSANNRVQPVGEVPITADWDEGSNGYRARRIRSMILSGAPHTVASLAAIQNDVTSGLALDVVAALANVSASAFASGGGGLALRAILAAWDGVTSVGSQQATLWVQVQGELAKLAAAETGEAHWPDPVFLLRALASDAAGAPDPACAPHPSCGSFAARALDAVAAANGIGPGTTAPPRAVPAWGLDVHVLQVDHAILSASPLACVADRRGFAHGGDLSTPNVGTFSFDVSDGDASQFAQSHGPSYRQVVDMGALDARSLFIHPMGVDGAPFSYEAGGAANGGGSGGEFFPQGAYDDLMSLWAAGTYVPMDSTSRGPPDAHVMHLRPA